MADGKHYTVVVQVKEVTPAQTASARTGQPDRERHVEDVVSLAVRANDLPEALGLAKAHLQTAEDNLS